MRFQIRHMIDMTIEAMTIYTRSNSLVTRRRLKDLSEGGLCFKSRTPLEEGSNVHVRIPVQVPAFETKGKVSWCRRKDSDYEIGIQFSERSVDQLLRMVGEACNIKRYRRIERKKGRLLTTDQAVREWLLECESAITDKVA